MTWRLPSHSHDNIFIKELLQQILKFSFYPVLNGCSRFLVRNVEEEEVVLVFWLPGSWFGVECKPAR